MPSHQLVDSRNIEAHLEQHNRELLDGWLTALGGLTFKAFINKAFPAFQWCRYVEVVVDAFQRLVDGDLILPDGKVADRLFVHLRYQTGKSTLAQLFAAYLLFRFKGIRIGVAMLRQDQTETFSRAVQNFYKQAGGILRSFAVHNWMTEGPSEDTRGAFWALSKGSTPTGKPADVLFGDDLLGGESDAHSANVFGKDKEWLRRRFLSRERVYKQPQLGRFLNILINTRQGLGDIASYWLYLGDWHCVILPTLYDPESWPIGVPVGPFPAGDGDATLPESTIEARNCSMEPDWRQVGEGLEESDPMLTAKAFHARRAINPGGHQSETDVSANEQGCPRPAAGGGIFHRTWLIKIPSPTPDAIVSIFRAHDPATTEGGGDWSASILMAQLANGKFVVLHGCRGRKSPAGFMQLLAALAIIDGPRVGIALPLSQGEGKLSFEAIRRDLTSMLSSLDLPAPTVRSMPVRTKTRPDKFKSAKHFRFAHPGGSFAEAAEPPGWSWADSRSEFEGNIQICPEYRPSTDHLEALAGQFRRDFPEILIMEKLGRAASGKLDPAQCKELNICPGPWHQVGLAEWHEYSGFDGGSDHYVDAAADAKRALLAGAFGRVMTI